MQPTSEFTYGDRVQYSLFSPTLNQTVLISEPIGYNDDSKELSRDKKFFGVIRKTSDSLKFYKGFKDRARNTVGGYEFIVQVRDIGLNENLTLIKEIRDNVTNVFKELYRSELDITTMSREYDEQGNVLLSIKSSDSGLDSILKARKDEDLEITRKYSLDDVNETELLPDVDVELVELKGRKIELIGQQYNNQTTLDISQDDTSFAVKSDLRYASMDSFQTVQAEDQTYTSSYFYVDEVNKYSSANFNYSLKYSFTIGATTGLPGGGADFYIEQVRKLDNNSTPQSELAIHNGLNTGGSFSGDLDIDITTVGIKGLRLGVGFHAAFTGTAQSAILTINEWEINVTIKSDFGSTTTKAYNAFITFERFLLLMTGKSNLFKSDFFDTGGIGENFFITDGELVRNIPVMSTDPNARVHQLRTSLKDAFQSFDAGWNLGLGIEQQGIREFVRIEQLEYFFQPVVILELGKLRNIKRKIATEYVYNATDIGYEGEAKIEGIQGLDKTNGKVNRISTITRLSNKYEKTSKYQTDDYPREIQRREQFINDPTLDVKYDDTKMILDCQDPKSTFSVTLIDNDLVNKGVVFETNISFELLFVQFAVAPTSNTIEIGVDVNESAENMLTYLTEVNFYKDWVSYSLIGTTITGTFNVNFTWTEVNSENLLGSVSYVINNYGDNDQDISFQQRTSLEDFDSLPTGVFDPEGLTNGRWNPLAMTLRHGWWIRAGLTDYLDTNLAFGASNSNTQLKGTLKNDNNYPYLKNQEYEQDDNILVRNLERNKFEPEWIEAEHVVSQETMDILEGSTNINGKSVKNFYCLVKFVNEEDEEETGFVFSVKPNGNGKWKFLAFRKIKK